ncbi:MAG: bifunctional (p)ppGpp synthetase/guanosine-3',5'-bis(diphosphate) 3'-pyrophosphohydrolase, partial [Gammaproteobacteria bacterium]|nr:bifunctional (p)ppGpp synthetase/guanosine-3',5'-bis(diphosphate) 3'-pyrophosphohydrolase [Gammaproteobacteria bacterium]
AENFKPSNSEEMIASIGRGDINSAQMAGAIQHNWSPLPSRPCTTPRTRKPQDESDNVYIHGVGNLLTNMARCCKPAPGDEIIGYITKGKGVSIHRRDCANVLKFDEQKRARLIDVQWSDRKEEERYPVDIRVQAMDREGLLSDITSLLASEKVNVLRVNTHTDMRDYVAHMELTVEINNTAHLSRILSRIEQLRNILSVRRYTQ